MSEEKKYPFAKEFIGAHLSKINQPFDVIKKLSYWTKDPKNLLYFSGNPGCGKTYFAAAFYNFLREKHESLSWNDKHHWGFRFISEYKLFKQLREKISDGYDWESCLETICDIKYLILDDMGSSRLSEWQIDVLHTLIDLRVSNLQPTLITSNIYTKDLDNYFHPRVKSRICSSRNLIVEVNSEDKRQIPMEVKNDNAM
jgi:DNA replication protein DnaC